MHQAAIVGEFVKDASSFGWDVPEVHHHWDTLVDNVQDYIRGLNYNYRVTLMSKHVTYYNQLAYVKDAHTVEGTDIFGEVRFIFFKFIVRSTHTLAVVSLLLLVVVPISSAVPAKN